MNYGAWYVILPEGPPRSLKLDVIGFSRVSVKHLVQWEQKHCCLLHWTPSKSSERHVDCPRHILLMIHSPQLWWCWEGLRIENSHNKVVQVMLTSGNRSIISFGALDTLQVFYLVQPINFTGHCKSKGQRRWIVPVLLLICHQLTLSLFKPGSPLAELRLWFLSIILLLL